MLSTALTRARSVPVQYAMYVVHWVACIFYFIARQEGFTSSSWLGAYPDLLMQWPSRFDSYIFSLYWAVTTFATVGYGAFFGPRFARHHMVGRSQLLHGRMSCTR